MMKYKILVVEDDKDIAEVIRLYLGNEGYEIITAQDGLSGYEILQKEDIHLAVVDIMLPKMNGYDLVKKTRENSNVPILILSAKNMDSDKILGLDLGADDYLTKPFNPLELVARVKSNIRRYYSMGNAQTEADISNRKWQVGELVLDEDAVTLTKAGEVVAITPTEYKMLALFMKTPGKVYTKKQIYQEVSGECYVNDDNTLMVHISNLRDKIEDNPRTPKYIKNVRGIGYKIEKI
ncbi:MAG: response regulator transcription factor [Lachnospiraceae bacterium]|nr:response regulator transcription factor [Lachnospiraceae bacterium]